jgi:hypothetical protein
VALLRERRFKAFRDEMFVTKGREGALNDTRRAASDGTRAAAHAHRADAERRVGDGPGTGGAPASRSGSRFPHRWRSEALSDFRA